MSHRSQQIRSYRFLQCSGFVIIALWSHGGPLSAQTDYRIDYRTNQGGQLLDASNRVGGTRFNTRVTNGRYQFDGGISAQNIVFGNVTGLGRFQGSSPIPGPNSFRGALPSAGLASFRARSFDLSQVRRGGISQGAAYFDQSNTIADLEMIRARRNIPGSSMMQSPRINLNQGVPGVMRQSPAEGSDGEFDLVGSRVTNVPVGAQRDRLGYTRQIGVDGRSNPGASDFSQAGAFASITQSTLFGAPGQLAPTPINRFDLNDRGPNRASRRPITARPGDNSISAQLAREDLLYGAGRQKVSTNDSQGAITQSNGLIDEPSDAIGVRQRTAFGDAPVAGDDLYARMIDALRNRNNTGDGQPVTETGGPDPFDDRRRGAGGGLPTASVEERLATGGLPSSVSKQLPGRADSSGVDDEKARAAITELPGIETVLDSPIRTFVAGSQSRVNRQMALGEAALRQRNYYVAAQHFDAAMVADSKNPLPYLARGHALAAAGDYMSAVSLITLGIKRFPEIAEFELDLPALVGQSDIFDRRRADLESLLEVRENVELRFLLGYLELYSGFRLDGLTDLQAAAKAAPPDSVIAIFPDLLLGRTGTSAPERTSDDR